MSYHTEPNEWYHLKEHSNLSQNRDWCRKFHTILLRVISLKNNQCIVFNSGYLAGPFVIHRLASMQKFFSMLELFCLYDFFCYSKTFSMLITNYNKLGIHNVGFCYAIHYFMDKLVVCLWAVKRLYVSPNFFLIVEGQRTNYSIYLWAGSWLTLK